MSDLSTPSQTERLLGRVSAAIDRGINGDPPHLLPGDSNDAAHAVLCEIADYLLLDGPPVHTITDVIDLLREEARRG